MWNQIKTILLLGALTALLLFIGSFFGPNGLTVAIIFVVLMNTVTYFFSDKIALFMYRAREIKKNDYLNFHAVIDELCKENKMKKPRLYIIPSEAANAFATGRNEKNAAVACTEGILKLLTKEELKGVLAHELSHIKNKDILITTIAATIAGIISYLAFMARFAAIFGGMGRNREGGGNILGLLALAILTPIIALIIQLAISRSREYLADERGAKMIKDSKPLARALEKIHHSVKTNPLRLGNTATSSLFIANPFKSDFFTSIFSTHPSLKDRLERLNQMKF